MYYDKHLKKDGDGDEYNEDYKDEEDYEEDYEVDAKIDKYINYEYTKYLKDINNPSSSLLKNIEWIKDNELLQLNIEEHSDCYDFILDFIEIYKRINSQQDEIEQMDHYYFLTGNFIQKTLFCYDFYKTLKDIELFIISEINFKTSNYNTILQKHISSMKQKNNIVIKIQDYRLNIYYKNIKLITFFYQKLQDLKNFNYVNIYDYNVEIPYNNNLCDENILQLYDDDNDNDNYIKKIFDKNGIKYLDTVNRFKLPYVNKKIYNRNLTGILNIDYLWNYTRHSKTLNINLLKIYNGEDGYDYPIVKEPSQQHTQNIIYQDKNFITKYQKKHPNIIYLYNGDSILEIKKKLIQVMNDIISNTEYDYSNGFFCYRCTKYVDLINENNIINLQKKIGQKIYIPQFLSCFRNLENINLNWLLSFRNVLLVIYVDKNIKKFISIDPCIKTVQCYFGSENELLFMPDCELKLLSIEKSLLNYYNNSFFINVILCKLEYPPPPSPPPPPPSPPPPPPPPPSPPPPPPPPSPRSPPSPSPSQLSSIYVKKYNKYKKKYLNLKNLIKKLN